MGGYKERVYKWFAAFFSKDGVVCATCPLPVPNPLSFICSVDDNVGLACGYYVSIQNNLCNI